MKITDHASVRSQQRGMPQKLIDFILEYGTPTNKPGGAFAFYIREKDKERIRKIAKECIQYLDKAIGRKVIIKDGIVLTVY